MIQELTQYVTVTCLKCMSVSPDQQDELVE